MNYDSGVDRAAETPVNLASRSTSPRVAARQAEARRRIIVAARQVVSEQGFAASQVAVVASIAEVATGTIYRHFPSKASLFSEMLRQVCQRELNVVEAVLAEQNSGTAERIADAVRTFVDRALRGGGLSYAVIVEPMDPDIDQVRLDARAGLATAFARAITEGTGTGELPPQEAGIRGAAIVGAFLEAVVEPLAARPVDDYSRSAISKEVATFCRNAVTANTRTSNTRSDDSKDQS